jgi:hypothetical protein
MSVSHTETEIIEIKPEIIEIEPEIIEMEEKQKEYTLTEAIQDGTEHILRSIIFWESEDKKIGIIIQMMHHAFIYGIILWYFYIHTFSTSYFQLVIIACIWFLIWLQHFCCDACILFNIECKLIGNYPSILDHFLYLFNIPASDNTKNGILFMISSIAMFMLSCEVLSRTIMGIKDFL